MYPHDTRANSQRTPTKINKNRDNLKVRICKCLVKIFVAKADTGEFFEK